MRGTVIFGAGQAGMTLYRLLQRGGKAVLAFGDSNPALWGTLREELPVWSPGQVAAAQPEEIFLAAASKESQREMETCLRREGCESRLIRLSDLRERFHIRLATARLLAEEIRRRRIPGDLAELGVYRGDFAEELNRLFPERKLYLFDTFSGFDRRDIGEEDGRQARPGRFSDTSAEAVFTRMPFGDQVALYPGYFPESLEMDGREKPEGPFALVSLDVDLYRPTLAGLSYFYRRLSPGGYILLDDYNSPQFPGAGQAVREFCDREGLSIVPLCDLHGTAVLAKPGGGK